MRSDTFVGEEPWVMKIEVIERKESDQVEEKRERESERWYYGQVRACVCI